VILLRLLFILVALILMLSGALYLFTGDRRYVRFAWQVVRFAIILLLVFALLFILERYVLAGWGILL
jgi:hypothetical protein